MDDTGKKREKRRKELGVLFSGAERRKMVQGFKHIRKRKNSIRNG